MSIFSILPITVNDPSLPKVPRAAVRPLGDAEFGAYEHWIFDKGNAAGLTGITVGKVLTHGGGTIAPVFAANYVDLNVGGKNGLLTDLSPASHTGGLTVWAVARQPAPYSGNPRPVFGNFVATTGMMATTSNNTSTPTTNAWVTGMTGIAPLTIDSAQPLSEWFFVAMSVKSQGGNLFRALAGDAAGVELTPAGTYAPGSAALSIGNVHYAGAPTAATIHIAEAGIVADMMTLAELTALRDRARARMAKRGITVV